MKLGVNIDHVATLRQQRCGKEPDPVSAALVAELAGANSIVCHLREDRRHIQEEDVIALRRVIKTRLNLEMAARQEIVEIALREKPDQVTLVPERRQELTTEGGLQVKEQFAYLKKVVTSFHQAGIMVSLFIEAESEQIKASADLGVRVVELHTGRYAESVSETERAEELQKIESGARLAEKKRVRAVAGHGLDYRNVLPVAGIAEIEELNIGYAIIGRAVFTGLETAVKDMVRLIRLKK